MKKFTNVINDLEIKQYDGRKISFCTKEGNLVKFQIPRMYMPFGISGFVPEIGATKWNIDFAMKGWDEEGNYVKRFYETLKEIENKIIQEVSNLSETIFGIHTALEDLKPMSNTESYKRILNFIHKKKSVSKKDILEHMNWGVRISFSEYRNRLRLEDTIKFTKNRYEVK